MAISSQALKEKVSDDQAKLQSDIKQFGANSPQAEADRVALKADHERVQDLRKDVRGDRATAATAKDLKTDQEQVKDLRGQVQDDRSQLKSDMKQYGKKSPQVAADKAALEKDRKLADGLKNDVHGDRATMARPVRMGGRRH